MSLHIFLFCNINLQLCNFFVTLFVSLTERERERDCVCLQRRHCANSWVFWDPRPSPWATPSTHNFRISQSQLLCRPMQHMNRIVLMHKILTKPVPLKMLFVCCVIFVKCWQSRKSLISVFERKSLVLVLVLEPWVLVKIPDYVRMDLSTFEELFSLVERMIGFVWDMSVESVF